MARATKKRTIPKVYADRIQRARARMAAKKLPAYLITNRMDHYYLTGFTGEDSAVLLTAKRVHVISDGRFNESIDKECPWAVKVLRKGMLEPEIGKVCRRLRLPSVAVQADHMTLASHGELRKAAKPTKLVKAPPHRQRPAAVQGRR